MYINLISLCDQIVQVWPSNLSTVLTIKPYISKRPRRASRWSASPIDEAQNDPMTNAGMDPFPIDQGLVKT